KKIDRIHIPTNCLDVLAQHIFGIAISERVYIDHLFNMIKRSYCYRNLSKKDFNEVIDYLSGKFISLEDRHIYAKIWYDESTGIVGKRGKLARVLYMTNIGTIPDESFVTVKQGERVIGHIDEGFLERLDRGDIFLLGGETYEFRFSRGMVAQVIPTPQRPPTVPSWFSEMLPLSFDLASEIQRFRKLINQKFAHDSTKKEVIEFILKHLYVDDNAAEAIYNFCREQYDYVGMPHSERILVEHYIDEKDKTTTVFHTLYGRRVNDVLSRAVAFAISRSQHRDVEIGVTDNGFYVTCDKKVQVVPAFRLLKAGELRRIMDLALDRSEVLKRRFRHCATRALMILREYKGHKKRVGRQQVSSMILMNAVKRISPDFFIMKEARREVLEDLMDIGNATKILELVEQDKIKLIEVTTKIPSPFAFGLILEGATDIMKIDDKQEFLRRMHTMILAKIENEKGKKKEDS
ncbi:MAG: ATP-dependent helicase, partial [archaeon]